MLYLVIKLARPFALPNACVQDEKLSEVSVPYFFVLIITLLLSRILTILGPRWWHFFANGSPTKKAVDDRRPDVFEKCIEAAILLHQSSLESEKFVKF